jgi:hypothetical protein
MRSLTFILFATVFATGILSSCSDDGPVQPSADGAVAVDAAVPVDGLEPTIDGKPANDKGSVDSILTGPEAAGSYLAQLESTAAGTEGVAIKVFYPALKDIRYAEGAPVVVSVPGGWDSGGLDPKETYAAGALHGFIYIQFLLPGGKSDNVSSGGEYDVRGPNCREALRQVLRYASGDLKAMDGKGLVDNIPFALVSEVGVVGGSNGGNLSLAAFGQFGAELQNIAWFAAWESPIGDQYALVELNKNGFYEPGTCDATTCPWPGLAEALRWDAAGQTGVFYPKKGGATYSGRLYAEQAGGPPIYFDSLATDPIGGGKYKLFPSVELAKAIRQEENNLWPGTGAPSWMEIGEAAVDAYWLVRDGALNIPAAHQHLPKLMVIHIQTEKDHVQQQPDYPHARSHVQGWLDAGHDFVRLNPDAAYMAYLSSKSVSDFPDNEVNTPVPWPNTIAATLPETVGGDKMSAYYILATVLELADRTHKADRSPNLGAVLFP